VHQTPRLRVLLGDLEPILAIGLRAVLEEEGIDVIGEEREPPRLLREAMRLQPDVVVLDLNVPSARTLGEQVRAAVPDTKVILWARDETVMEVLESLSRAPRLVPLTGSEGLRNELSNSRNRPQVEE
jgi:DNA-binding NarL/FixJ family response regulator